jgi:SAM-dependent methyltransferase
MNHMSSLLSRLKPFSFAARWPYQASDFVRLDESSDTRFYHFPRFVNHIDDQAITHLTNYYRQAIPKGAHVLDLASSWVSHLPTDMQYSSVIGLGLNREELQANPLLTQVMVQDLNTDTKLPMKDESVDHIICNVSIDYLVKPREICQEAGRVLKTGGVLHLAISNRCFPSKVVSRWLKISEEERRQMVADYMHFAASDDGSQRVFKDISCVEVVDGKRSDPLHIVRGTKA